MRIGGVEIRRMTQAERGRLPASAWPVAIGIAVGVAVLSLALDLGLWIGYLVALLVGAMGAYWMLRSVQR